MSANPDVLIPADEQQARLLERLRAAGGQPVSFEELRSLGIENPAVLCYELDLVGISIARVHRYERPGHAVPLGVRIEDPAALEPCAAARGQPVASGLRRARLRAREARAFARAALRCAAAATPPAGPSRRAVAVTTIALVVLAAASATLVVTARSGRSRARVATAQTDARRDLLAGAGTELSVSRALALTRETASIDAPAGAGLAGRASARSRAADGAQLQLQHNPGAFAAARLEMRGHQLLGEGRYASAIGVLRAALGASGESSSHCGLPASEACLTYAYALYDLGRALRLEGERQAAVGVLSERLQIANQRTAVRRELEQAKATAGGGRGAGAISKKVGVPQVVAHPRGGAQPLGPANTQGRTGGTPAVVPTQG